jgi:integrase
MSFLNLRATCSGFHMNVALIKAYLRAPRLCAGPSHAKDVRIYRGRAQMRPVISESIPGKNPPAASDRSRHKTSLLDLCVGEARQGRERLRPVLIVAADTGLRQNELFILEASDLDLECGVITVRAIDAKTNNPRQIPMTRRVYEAPKKLCGKNPHLK